MSRLSRIGVLFSGLILFCTIKAQYPTGDREVFMHPAEFDRQEAVWIGARPSENGHPTLDVVIQMIKALAPHVRIKLMVADDEAKTNVQRLLRENGIDQSQVDFWTTASSPTRWYRDVGAIFLRGSQGHLKAVDFNFNCYGNCLPGSDEARKKEGIDREIAKIAGVPIVRSELVTEGGAHDFNGRGVMIANETLELGRNPNMTRDQIEAELKRALGQKKVIWLQQGIAEDDAPRYGPLFGNVYPTGDTGGHVDEFCRFVDRHTVLLASVTPAERDSDPVMKINYDRMEENYRILKSATDQDGRAFRIIRVPAADIISETFTIEPGDAGPLDFFHGSKPGETVKILIAASYLNFFISNGVVLISRYWKSGRPNSTRQKDETVKRLMRRLFPGREIIQIDAENLNFGGGGMHCATQEQPAAVGH